MVQTFDKIHHLGGYQLIETATAVIESKIPKRHHKSKRVQKKWIKKYGYRMIPNPQFYVMGNKILAHPAIIKKIIKSIEEGNASWN